MSRKALTICGLCAVFALVALGVFLFRPWGVPVIAAPFTIEPIVLYGIDTPDPGLFARYGNARYARHRSGRHQNHVYVLAVSKGGNFLFGEEVTHKINAQELIALLAQTRAARFFPIFQEQQSDEDDDWSFSIFLHQNRYMHIIIREGRAEMIAGRNNRSYTIFDACAIRAALERMIAEYESPAYKFDH